MQLIAVDFVIAVKCKKGLAGHCPVAPTFTYHKVFSLLPITSFSSLSISVMLSTNSFPIISSFTAFVFEVRAGVEVGEQSINRNEGGFRNLRNSEDRISAIDRRTSIFW
jgi:hypothetical protein